MDNVKTDFYSVAFKPIEIKKIRNFRWYNPFTWLKLKYIIKKWELLDISEDINIQKEHERKREFVKTIEDWRKALRAMYGRK